MDGVQGSFDEFPQLQPVEPWKFGYLYQCSKCRRFWFLHESRHSIRRIQDHLLPLCRHWNTTSLTLDTTNLSALASIGGIANKKRTTLTIPCSVQNVSGRYHEKAVVLVSKQPPYFWYQPTMVHWADEVKAIVPSPFALPSDVRLASAQQEEIAMGFAPTGVRDQNGKEYTLTWESTFFNYRGVKGEEIRLSGRQQKWKKQVLPDPADAYYWVDWFDGCQTLLEIVDAARKEAPQ
jgi:hypothetical protein